MKKPKMTDGVRLNAWEQNKLREKAVEINKILINRGAEPLKDSELIHAVLEYALNKVTVSKTGQIIIE